LLSSRPVVSLKASKSRRTVPREARLARMMSRSSSKDVKECGIARPSANVRSVMAQRRGSMAMIKMGPERGSP